MATPLIPQEVYLLERYCSVEYFERMRGAWALMVKASDDALDAFMQNLPPDYRNLPLHKQPDVVWGERILPNLRWTLTSLDNGFNMLSRGEWDGLRTAGNARTALTGLRRDYSIEWMGDPFQATFSQNGGIADRLCSNIQFTALGEWRLTDLSSNYHEPSRGLLTPPPTWPIYRLNSQVQVRTGDKVPRNGVYLPDVNDSCAQVLVEGYEAREANVGYDSQTMQRIGLVPATWTLVERVAGEGGGVPGREGADQHPLLKVAGGEPCSQAGWWLTPAKVGGRRYFRAGDIMPVIEGSDYGTTFWQWDGNQSGPNL